MVLESHCIDELKNSKTHYALLWFRAFEFWINEMFRGKIETLQVGIER
jgi:hypothetical protein